MSCPHGFDLDCRLCPSYQDQIDEENFERALTRMSEERALEAAVVEAAIMCLDTCPNARSYYQSRVDVAARALAAFREKAGRR